LSSEKDRAGKDVRLSPEEIEKFVDFAEMAVNFAGAIIVDEKHADLLMKAALALKQQEDRE
jgi:Holliday junction resolvase